MSVNMDALRIILSTWGESTYPRATICLFIEYDVIHVGLEQGEISSAAIADIIKAGKCAIIGNVLAGLKSHVFLKSCCACHQVRRNALPGSDPPYCRYHAGIDASVRRIQGHLVLYRETLAGLLPEIIRTILQAICDLI